MSATAFVSMALPPAPLLVLVLLAVVAVTGGDPNQPPPGGGNQLTDIDIRPIGRTTILDALNAVDSDDSTEMVITNLQSCRPVRSSHRPHTVNVFLCLRRCDYSAFAVRL